MGNIKKVPVIFNNGFTLIELLVVISVIAILTTIILASLNGATTKSKKSAFKSEASSAQPKLVSDCDTGTLAAPTNGTQTTAWSIVSNSCGPSGALTFTINANAAFDNNCKATVNEKTTTFTSQCN